MCAIEQGMEMILFSYCSVLSIISTEFNFGNETDMEIPCPSSSPDCEKVRVRAKKIDVNNVK
jgi:hypothetical protein